MSVRTIICALIVGLTLTCTSAHAMPMLELSNGDITGVSGLLVDGDRWNATFNDGSFAAINLNTPIVYSDPFATSATAALFAYLDTLDHMAFDPADFVGCTSSECYLSTVISANQSFFDARVVIFASSSTTLPPNIVGGETATDYTQAAFVSWAPAAVPEPSVVLLMASGMIALRVTRRKRRA